MSNQPQHTVHNSLGTPGQRAAYQASLHHFRLFYRWRHNAGWGDGHSDIGAESSPLPDQVISSFIERASLQITAEVQADGVRFDPKTLVVEIERIEPLD